jgi:hypothetical protein
MEIALQDADGLEEGSCHRLIPVFYQLLKSRCLPRHEFDTALSRRCNVRTNYNMRREKKISNSIFAYL